jgi:hypothetical protein
MSETEAKGKLYIHIGTEKCGTSALQHFFSQNRKILVRYGVDYPDCREMFAHHRLPWSLFPQEGRRSRLAPDDLKDHRQEWLSVLTAFQRPVALLSSEFFFRRKPQSLHIIRELVSDYDVKIIVYLRRQDNFEDSWYNQRVKGTRCTTRRPFTGSRSLTETCFNRWVQAFGKENIIVRPYEKSQFYNGSIFADVLHYGPGLVLTDEYVLPKKDPNTRLHPVVLEYKRLVNHLPLTIQEKAMTVLPLRELSGRLQESGRPDYSVYSPQQRLAMIRCYEPFYRKIARDYLGREDGNLFYDPLPDPKEAWQPYHELTKEDARSINDFLAAEHPAFLSLIRRGITTACLSGNTEMKAAAALLSPGIALDGCSGSKRLTLMMAARTVYNKMPVSVRSRLKQIARKLHAIP